MHRISSGFAGNSTCVQTNLDKKGRFKSETVSCLAPGQTCSPGEGMKACFSGACISASAQCVNMPLGSKRAQKASYTALEAVSHLIFQGESPCFASKIGVEMASRSTEVQRNCLKSQVFHHGQRHGHSAPRSEAAEDCAAEHLQRRGDVKQPQPLGR